jgi:anti-anti-sigma factor
MAIVLRPHGKLDLKEAVKLKQKMHEVARTPDLESHQFWIVDLAKVNDLDHFGAIALLEVRQYAQQTGHQFFLSNASNTVKSVLNIAHIAQEFNFLDHNDCLPNVALDRGSSTVSQPAQTSQRVPQLPVPASQHSHRLYKTIASLKSKLVERSADLPVSV